MRAPTSFCPYVGLKPFHEEDRPYFFGRETEARTEADALFASRLTLFYGASGVGKSSVLMAGVIPQLRREARTAVVLFRSWQLPDAALQLKRAIVDAVVAQASPAATALDPNQPLDELLRAASEALDGTVLVLLDQFEEYFLYFPETADGGFDAELARSITRRDIDAGFMVALREDAVSRLDRFRARIPQLFGNTQRLAHLTPEAARRAITEPLAVYNRERPEAQGAPVTIEPALVDALLEQTVSGRLSLAQGGGAGQGAVAGEAAGRIETPFLQLVLERLWSEEIDGGSRVLRLATLDALGGAQTIARNHVDSVMNTLDARDQALCARFFDRLVTPSGAKIAYSVRDLTSAAGDLAGEVQRVTQVLQDNRILVKSPAPPGRPTDEDQYQIFHDVLAAGVLDWRTRWLAAQERARASAEAAQQERERADEARRVDEQAARERELRLAQERAGDEAARAEAERRRADAEMALGRKLRWAVAGLVVLAAAAGLQTWRAGNATDKANTERAAAEQSAEQARTAEAVAKRETARAVAANTTVLAERVWERYGTTRNVTEAIGALDLLRKDYPPNTRVLNYLGRAFLDRGGDGDAERAAAAFTQALALAPPPPGVLDEPPSRSAGLVEPTPEMLPSTVEALAGRAAARTALDRPAEALRDLDAAVKLDSGNASVFAARAALRDRTGDAPGALADYDEALRLQPTLAAAQLGRGRLLLAQGAQARAATDFRAARDLARDADTKRAASAALAALPAFAQVPAAAAQKVAARQRVFVQCVNRLDCDRLWPALRATLDARGFAVQPAEVDAGFKTNGDVRFVGSDDAAVNAAREKAAREVAALSEGVLADAGERVSLKTIVLDPRRFTAAPGDVIELWIPDLKRRPARLAY